MADEFGRYSPITPEPILTLEELARRNKVRSDEKARVEAERKRREQLLILEAKRQAQSKAETEAGNEDLRRPAPLKRRDDDEDLRRPQRTVQETPKTVKVGDVEKPIDAALADIPGQMEFEAFVLSSPLKDRARRRARTEELIEKGKSPEEAAKLAQKEQEDRQAAFERGRVRAQSSGGDGAGGFVAKESAVLGQDLVQSYYGPAAGILGFRGEADQSEAFRAGMQAELADWRNEKSPYPQIQGAVSGAANSMAQMVPGIAASAVAGPGVGMGVMAAQFGGQEYNRAKYEGAEAGLAGSQLEQYALIQGGVEATVMPIMNKIPGLAGIEGRVLRQSIARGVAQHPTIRKAIASGVKTLGKDVAAEVTEEVITEVLHGLGDEKLLSRDVDYKAIIADTVLQTVVMMGMTEGVQRASGIIGDRMTPNPSAPAAGTVPPSPTVDPATQAAEPVPVESQAAPAAAPEPFPPAVEAFMQNPSSARAYEAAVKAGMPPIEKPNREGRARYADELRKRRPADPVSQPAAPLEPTAVDREPVETPSGTVPDGMQEWMNALERGNSNGQETNVNQEQQGREEFQGGQEGLLTPAGTQNVTTPADSQQSPALTRESFEQQYRTDYAELNSLAPDDPARAPIQERLSSLYESNPDWADEIHNNPTPSPVVGPGEAQPDQSSVPATGPVSSEPKRYPSAIKRYPAKVPDPYTPGREYDAPPVYLTGVSNDQSREAAKSMPNLGVMLTPRTQQYKSHLNDYQFFGVDNGAFTGKFNEKAFYKLLDDIREQGDSEKALFAAAPDVVGDWQATLKASEPHLDRIRDAGFPVALVLQNGATPDTIPWDRIDALFVGGDNNFKLAQKDDSGRIDWNAEMFPIIKEAEKRDVPIHFGRVNSAKRLEMVHFGMKGRSADGTFLKFGNPDQQTEKVMAWLRPWGKFPDAKPTGEPALPTTPATPSNSNQLPATPTDSPVPAFAALPQKSQDLFNKAFDSKDVEQLKQMVDKSNVAWNKEFERRTGVKLPRTLKDRYRTVMEWANPTPTYGKRSEIPKWGIYQTMFQGKPKFSVKESDNDKGFGDSLHDTAEEAKKYADIGRQRETERAEAAAKRQAAEEADQKKQQYHEASFQGFLTNDPMVKGRRLKTLDTLVNYEKKPISRKALVEKLVADGWAVNDEDQLQAPTGEFLDVGALTKTGIDYARHLIDLRPANADTPPADSQLTDIEAAMAAELDRLEAAEASAKAPKAPKPRKEKPKAAEPNKVQEAIDNATRRVARLEQELQNIIDNDARMGGSSDATKIPTKEAAIASAKQELADLIRQQEESRPPAKPPRTKTGEKLGALSTKTGDARKAAVAAFLAEANKGGAKSLIPGAVNPKAVVLAASMAKAFVADGTVKFADFVMKFVEDTSPAIARQFSDYLEAAWKMIGQRDPELGLDPAGKVTDVLGPETGVKDNATGNDGTTGREEDQGGSQPDSGDTQDATGPADAEVLGSEPAEDGQTAKKPRGSKRIRGSTRGTVRQGNRDADSGTGDGAERSGNDGGGTSADDAGEGRGDGIDRAPQSTRPNYHLTNPEAIIGGGPKAKFQRNRKAIEIVRDIEESNRTPTAEELDTLAGYMGWGAFGQELFNGSWENPRPKEAWENEDEWLRTYLGEEEWKSAQLSIKNAHFTDPQTVSGVWDMLRRMGFDGGRVLEPSMGVGNFFSLMPRDLMERSTLTGIELDKITAKIAKLLHPQINIQQKGYQESQTPDNFYDVIVSNVPFGDYPIADRRYKQDFSIHNYFFKRAFDQVKPGGVIAFLTSNATMDGKAQAKLLRAQIAKQGDLVTAIRFPSGAFQAYAGTKVVADLIIIRKRKEGDTPQAVNWIDVVEMDTPAGQKITVNEFWQNNPQNILGTMTWGHGTTSKQPGMIVNQPTDLQARLNEAVKSVPENVINTERSATQGRERPNTTAMRQNSVIAQDNELWIVKGEQLVPLLESTAWYRKGSKQATIDNNRKEIESLLNVREAMRSVLDRQAASEDSAAAREALNKTYDQFVKEHGPIGKSAAARHLRKAGDPMGSTLLSLEKLTNGKYEKRSIFEKSTVRQRKNIQSPTVDDAFAIERNRSLDLDMDRIAAASKTPVAEVISKLVADGKIYKTGNGTYDASDVFLSGNMARKLRQLQAAQSEGMDGLERSIEAIRERIPAPVPYSQIEAKLGATWIESSDYADMIGYLLNEPSSSITVERRITGWKVTIPTEINRKTEATRVHGHPGIEFSKLMTAAMNNATVKLTMPDPDDRNSKIADPISTAEANAKINELRENFSNWLWASPERITRLSGVYNEEFNSTVTPTFDEVPLQFEGITLEKGDKPFNLRKHQMSAVWRAIVSGKGIFAHEVGTGKTFTMAALAMESRRLGLASKPILLAHNANSLAVRNEIQEAYPSANILYVDNLDAANKQATLQAIATENWDLIVVPHSMAENFQLRPETVEALLKPEMDALEAAALEAFAESDSSDYAKGTMPADLDTIDKEDLKALKEPTAKELVRERLKLRAKIDKAKQAMDKGTGIFFEDMGVDMLMVDEAHLFKKLPITTKQTIKGLNKAASQMGTMMMMMTDYIRANNKGRGVYMFSGTPITNTINEIFNMMRFVMAEEMESSNVRDWDAWFNNFATSETLTELSSGGTWENFDRLSSFVNLPELRQMVGQYMDIVFADDMEEFKPRAEREGRSENPQGRPYKQIHNVIIDMIDSQRELSAQLAQRYTEFKNASGREKVRMMREPGGRHNPVVIEGEGVKLAMDPRLAGFGTKLVDEKLVTDTTLLDPKNPNLKINKMIQNAMIHYNEHPKTAQMVFMQVGYTDWAERTVGRDAAGEPIKQKVPVFNLAREIKRRLMEEGVPENEIVIFSSLSKEKRTEAAELMKQGIVRFAIGSTETMGTGVNAQDELIAMHHLDAPWMPGDLDQRNGRGHRQGNKWNTVNEYRYLTEGPQDGRRWQVLLTKDRFIKEFMRGDSTARVIEMDDIDMSEEGGTDMEQTFSAAAGDPRIMQRIRLEGQIEKLQRLRDNHARTITETADQANGKLRNIKQQTENIDVLKKMYATWAENRTETPEITLRGQKYTGNQEVTDQLQALAERFTNTIHARTQLGEYRGLPLFVDNGTLYVGATKVFGSDWAGTANSLVSAKWNLSSLQGIMSNLPERISKLESVIEKDQRFIDMATKAVGEQFPKQKQLDSKQKQLQKLQSEMTLNPTAAPAWLRAGAPIGTAVYWKGEKYDVTGHRMDHSTPFVLYSENDEFKPMPAAELTDAEGTRLFPELPETPAGTPDPATQPTVAEPTREPVAPETEPERLRREADQAQQELRQIQALNEQYVGILKREWKQVTSGASTGSFAVLSKEASYAIAGLAMGAVKAQVKSFEVFVRQLRAELAEDLVKGAKPNIIAAWNALRNKYGLYEATEAAFDAVIAETGDVDLQQAAEAAAAASTPTPETETRPTEATPDPEPLEPDMEGPERLYSTQNAATDAERERLGVAPRQPKVRQRNEPLVNLAAAMGKTVQGAKDTNALIAELTVKPRATTPLENHQLNFRYAQLDQKYSAALEERNAARRIGDDVSEAIAERESGLYLKEQTDLLELLSGGVSYFLGAGLQARKTLIQRDFSMARSLLEFEAAYGREPNGYERAAMEQQIADLEAAKADLQKIIDEQAASIEDLNAKLKEAHDAAVVAEPARKPSVLERIAKAGKERTDRGFEKLNAMRGKLFSIETATAELVSALTDIATGYSMQGVKRLADFLSRVEKRFGPDAKKITAQLTDVWNTVVASSSQGDLEQITGKIDPADDDSIGRAARELHRFVIQRDGLTASAEDRERAATEVHIIMANYVEGITPEQVARAMSGIGVYSELNKDEVEVIRRDQKAQLLLLQQLGDWKKGEAPPATGREMPPVSDEQRELRRAVNEAKKDAGIVTTTEGQLRSALDAAKRMAKNRISDLTKAIDENEPLPGSKKILQDDGSPEFAELTALRARRDELQKRYDEAFGKRELSDEQRLNAAEKALDRAISDMESDLASGKLYSDPAKQAVTSPAIEAKRAALDALKASREELRLSSGEAQARSDAAYERHLLEKDAELARRLAENDFKPAEKKPARVLTPAMLKAMQAIQKKEEALLKKRREWEFANRHVVYRMWKKYPVQAMGMIRKGLTTIDQSLIGRQGWLLGITHPLIYGKAIRKAFASNMLEAKSIFPTEQDVFNTEAALDADENWVRLEKIGKLAVTGVHGGLKKTEENYSDVPAWFDNIPGIGGSERAGSAFINSQRRLVFRELVTQLAKMQGKGEASLSSADLRVIGNMVNVASGRASLGRLENSIQGATMLFFSPRWWASRLQTLVGAPIYSESRWLGGEGASTEVRLLVAKEWAKQMAAQTAIMTLAVSALAAAFGEPGDDEEWDWYANPSNPNFGRLRIGSTYIDMTAGIGAHVALLGRLVTGKQVDRWETKDIDRWRMFLNYGRTKLAPVPGIVADWMDGQSIGQDPFGSTDWMLSKAVPLSIQDVWKTVKEEGLPLGSIVSTMMFFGLGAQTREAKTRSRADISNEIRAMRKQSKPPEKIQAALQKHLEYTAKIEAREKLRTANPDEKAALESVVAGNSQQAMANAVEKEKYDLTIRALEMLSSEDPTKKKAAGEDASITTARAILKEIAPTYEQAQEMFNRAYMAKHGPLTMIVGEKGKKRRVAKDGVIAARRRLRAIYSP